MDLVTERQLQALYRLPVFRCANCGLRFNESRLFAAIVAFGRRMAGLSIEERQAFFVAHDIQRNCCRTVILAQAERGQPTHRDPDAGHADNLPPTPLMPDSTIGRRVDEAKWRARYLREHLFVGVGPRPYVNCYARFAECWAKKNGALTADDRVYMAEQLGAAYADSVTQMPVNSETSTDAQLVNVNGAPESSWMRARFSAHNPTANSETCVGAAAKQPIHPYSSIYLLVTTVQHTDECAAAGDCDGNHKSGGVMCEKYPLVFAT